MNLSRLLYFSITDLLLIDCLALVFVVIFARKAL